MSYWKKRSYLKKNEDLKIINDKRENTEEKDFKWKRKIQTDELFLEK